MKNPGRRMAIRKKCLECSGDSPKETVLCHPNDCPLWPFRLGIPISSPAYRARIEAAFKNHPDDVAELVKLGLNKEDFLRLPEPTPTAPSEAPTKEEEPDSRQKHINFEPF